MQLNSNQIQEIIPHRYPFLLVDKVIEMNETKIKAIKNVSANEMQFMGHFPQKHLMPGVLIVEALAQAGAILLLSKPEHKNKLAYFIGIDKCRFKGQVIPGDTLTLEAELINFKGFMGIAQVKASVDDKVVVIGEIRFALDK
ncbi:MAG: 3-hydroxyacyl-ACP dehydratase FabZ [Bacilli bacterium]|jgi:3-hydroxyacyl-[acyl-carrier-protein] dehydratase|nr:3-hydroxyacyl-ACP dehydratase FabZ [Bacilli bacterium]